MSIRRFEDIESWQMSRGTSWQGYDLSLDAGLGRDSLLKHQQLELSGTRQPRSGAHLQHLTRQLHHRGTGQPLEQRAKSWNQRTL